MQSAERSEIRPNELNTPARASLLSPPFAFIRVHWRLLTVSPPWPPQSHFRQNELNKRGAESRALSAERSEIRPNERNTPARASPLSLPYAFIRVHWRLPLPSPARPPHSHFRQSELYKRGAESSALSAERSEFRQNELNTTARASPLSLPFAFIRVHWRLPLLSPPLPPQSHFRQNELYNLAADSDFPEVFGNTTESSRRSQVNPSI